MDKGIKLSSQCLNCGCSSNGSYCPVCGQPLSTPKKITMKVFWKSVAMSFARLTPGFWCTFTGLILHPWVVIREYINGKRIKYSPPITMVIQLLLYFTFIFTILGNVFHIDFFSSTPDEEIVHGNWIINLFVSSDIIAKIVIESVFAINAYIAYGLTTGRKYNLAEYLVAAIYMGCCFSIYNNLLRPLAIFYPTAEQIIKYSIILVIGTIALAKAFPIQQWWKRCLTWMGFMVLNLIALLVAVLIVLLISYIYPSVR